MESSFENSFISIHIYEDYIELIYRIHILHV